MPNSKLLRVLGIFFALGFAISRAQAEENASIKVAKLSLEVQRLEDVRTVKRLQISYAQYAQFGLWSQMAALFAQNGQAIYGSETVNGQSAIEKFYRDQWGGGREGLPPGGVRAQFDDTPVVNLSADGKSATGTWQEFATMGVYGGSETMNGWALGGMVNEYVKENGVWKILRLHYFPYATGSYKDGWRTAGTVPYLPFPFTPSTAPVVTPPLPAGMAIPFADAPAADALVAVNRRIAALNDEDKIRNLQNAFGYYKDRKMWDDITDLFAPDAVLEDAGAGIYDGPVGVRRWLLRMGPSGLKRGELNDGVLFDESVNIASDGRSARMRGMEWRELGDNDTHMARLGISTFVNSYAKGKDGIWRIRQMRIFPIALTDYYQGWNKSRIAPLPASDATKPDHPVPAADQMRDGAVPAFFQDHPVTGTPVPLPAGAKILAAKDLLSPQTGVTDSLPAPPDITSGLVEANRRFSRSYAYDAVDNVTHAFGFFLVDNDFKDEAALYAADGWRGKQAVGFCQGPDHIVKCETTWPGGAPLPHPRMSWGGRLMFQPVITISDDGRFAAEHTRLHSFRVSNTEAGVLSGAMYNDQFKVVDGVWKADVISIEEPYWSSNSYADGWANFGAAVAATGRTPPPGAIAPDVPRYEMLKIRFWGIDDHPNPAEVVYWPDIKPMWLNYTNPVSGRLPPNYCPNIKTCEKDLEAVHHVPVR